MPARSEPGRRMTRQLGRVLEAVRSSGVEHPTADRVFERVRRDLPRISLGTVYRNLQRLAADGLIGVTHLEDRIVRYDPMTRAHDHFVCRACGRIEDLATTPPAPSLRAARRAGHVVTAHALVLYATSSSRAIGRW
jgi:Fe2+ or Zn2+ uptake regulation protein